MSGFTKEQYKLRADFVRRCIKGKKLVTPSNADLAALRIAACVMDREKMALLFAEQLPGPSALDFGLETADAIIAMLTEEKP